MKIAQVGLIVSLLSGAAVMACGTNDTGGPAGARADEVVGIGTETGMNGQADTRNAPTGSNPSEDLQSPVFAVCSDSQIAAILRTGNQGEIQLVSGIFDRLTNADARSFAQRLIRDHTRMLRDLDALIRARNFVISDDNAIVQELQDATQLELAHLRTLGGNELDRAFVNHEVLDHLQDLALIDHMLLPSAKDPLLAANVRTARGAIMNHAQFAVQLQTRIEGACGGPSRSENNGGTMTDAGATHHDAGGGGTTTTDAGSAESNADCGSDSGETQNHGDNMDAGSASHDNTACDGAVMDNGSCPNGTSATATNGM